MRRIPEKYLLWCAFALGGVGAWLGMKAFRHKTQHTKFTFWVPVFAVINLAMIAGFLWLTHR